MGIDGGIKVDELQFIKESLKNDLEYWERAEKENPDSAFYRGTVASLRAFKEKIKFVLEDGRK